MMIAGNGPGNGIYASHPAVYIMTLGLIAAKVTNRLVVVHMTKSEMDYMDTSLLGPFLMFMNQYFNTPITSTHSANYLLYFSLVWVWIDLWLYCSKVCIEICDSLDIHLFKIRTPSSLQESSSSKKSNATSVPVLNSESNTRSARSGTKK